MTKTMTQKIVTHLWFEKGAEDAVRFYASIFPDSRLDASTPMPADNPSGKAGEGSVVEFTLFGQKFMAINAGKHHEFNDAMSLLVSCDTQAEIDKYTTGLLECGGKQVDCGWVIDRWGVRWQIHASVLDKMLADPDRAKAKRAMEAMLKMKKLDIARLQAAYDGA